MTFFESVFSSLGLGGVVDAGQALGAFFDTITNGRMWRSLGWLLLGVVLIIIGAAMWLRAEVL